MPDRQSRKELDMENYDLIAKIVAVLTKHNLWEDDGTYTFPDGDRWARFDPDKENEYLNYTKEENEKYGY